MRGKKNNNNKNTQIYRTGLFRHYKNNVQSNVEMSNRILCERQDPKKIKLVFVQKKENMSKAKDHLPSITTIDCTYCSERSGAPCTTVIDDETISKKVGEMLGFMRVNSKEVNEDKSSTKAITKMKKSERRICIIRTCGGPMWQRSKLRTSIMTSVL